MSCSGSSCRWKLTCFNAGVYRGDPECRERLAASKRKSSTPQRTQLNWIDEIAYRYKRETHGEMVFRHGIEALEGT